MEFLILLGILATVVLWKTGLLRNLFVTAHTKAQAARDRAEIEAAQAAVDKAVLEEALRKVRGD